jgi:transposase
MTLRWISLVPSPTIISQRLDKILQGAGVTLSSVASDVLGRSGRAMLDALVAGSRDPEALAELARGVLRKIPALRAALTGRFTAHHALLVGEVLAKLDYLEEAGHRAALGRDRPGDRPFRPAGRAARHGPGDRPPRR